MAVKTVPTTQAVKNAFLGVPPLNAMLKNRVSYLSCTYKIPLKICPRTTHKILQLTSQKLFIESQNYLQKVIGLIG